MKYTLIILFTGLINTLAFSQATSPIDLQWKIAAGDTIRYKIAVVPINKHDELPFLNSLPLPLRSLVTSMEAAFPPATNQEMDSLGVDYSAGLPKVYLGIGDDPLVFAQLTQAKPGTIAVGMHTMKSAEEMADYRAVLAPLLEIANQAKDAKEDSMASFIRKQLAATVTPEVPLFQGAVYARGGVQSFYLPVNMKNLLALLFELPRKSMREKDSWPLDVHLIYQSELEASVAQRRNQVVCRELRQQGSEQIAVLDYDFAESVAGQIYTSPTSIALAYRAIGEFSVTQGRWLKYTAVYSVHLTGEQVSYFGPFDTNLLISFP